MRILITNDDGINAPGLEVLHAIAVELAGPNGEVWTVAPAFEQSGVGHAISYTHPMMIAELSPRRHVAEGSPADCVIAALHEVMGDLQPDLVLSGVNRGNNAAENVLYSGTVGGAMEAALQGLRAVALSQFMGPKLADLETPFEAARDYGVAVIRKLLDHGVWSSDGAYKIFYNVNFPPVPSADVRGMRICTQGRREDCTFTTVPHDSPAGRRFLWIKSGYQHNPTDPSTDAGACVDGYIAITPMRADLTAHDAMVALRTAFE